MDGVLCDGGESQAQRWDEMPRGFDDPLQFVDGWMSKDVAAVVGPSTVGIEKLVLMNRYLRTTEMLSTYRAWKKSSTHNIINFCAVFVCFQKIINTGSVFLLIPA